MTDFPQVDEAMETIRQTYRKHQRWVPIVSFVCGFLFDMLMLKRIDEPAVIIQQAAYLLITAVLIGLELIEHTRELQPPGLLKKVWRHREALLHFLLGTLLNSYTIFYFKSASALTSFIFIAILISVLTLTEFKRFGKAQTQVHLALWSLCLVSYFVSLVPILLGFMGLFAFALAVLGSALVFTLYYRVLLPKLVGRPRLRRTHLVYPFAGMNLIFIVLYFLHAIPPVPLSVKYLGIYHGAKREDKGEYLLSYNRPAWKFWQHGDQDFLARPGDTIHCFAQIFSPARFKDKLQVRWLFDDPKQGWISADAIPLPVVGGREEGYRAVTRKANFQPGDWRVQIETEDSREIGRIHFTVQSDPELSERVMATESR